jgi:hypothetical protein
MSSPDHDVNVNEDTVSSVDVVNMAQDVPKFSLDEVKQRLKEAIERLILAKRDTTCQCNRNIRTLSPFQFITDNNVNDDDSDHITITLKGISRALLQLLLVHDLLCSGERMSNRKWMYQFNGLFRYKTDTSYRRTLRICSNLTGVPRGCFGIFHDDDTYMRGSIKISIREVEYNLVDGFDKLNSHWISMNFTGGTVLINLNFPSYLKFSY